MGYIIVWRNSHTEPHIETTSHDFKEEYSSYEDAKESAESTLRVQGTKDKYYFDYAIYEEVKS